MPRHCRDAIRSSCREWDGCFSVGGLLRMVHEDCGHPLPLVNYHFMNMDGPDMIEKP